MTFIDEVDMKSSIKPEYSEEINARHPKAKQISEIVKIDSLCLGDIKLQIEFNRITNTRATSTIRLNPMKHIKSDAITLLGLRTLSKQQ